MLGVECWVLYVFPKPPSPSPRFSARVIRGKRACLRRAAMLNPWLLDGLVIFGYFALVISIGLYKGRGERTMEGFAVGDRNIAWWAVLASICAAEVSAGTFLGTPGEGYGLRNFTYGQLAIGTVLARIIVAYLFIARFYDLRVVSIYEFLEVRFGQSTK